MLHSLARLSPLPALKLFTSGPACSLCTDLHHALSLLHPQLPAPPRFTLETYDLRPSQADSASQATERKAWRRKYKYDVPVLHLVRRHLAGETTDEEEILRHRMDPVKLETALAAERTRLGLPPAPGAQ